MSALLGVFGTGRALPGDALVRRMLGRMAKRGAGATDVRRGEGFVLAVARHPWETADDLGGPATVVTDGDVSVVADAALYHRDDLRRALAARGVRPSGGTGAHLVLAAYRAWGERAPERLEGDFAFVLWDAAARRVLCARDFAGKRPLLYAELPGALVVASTAGGVLAHPLCPRELNPVSLAETAAGMWAGSDETAFRAVRTLHAGFTLVGGDATRTHVDRHWAPPAMRSRASSSFDDAAEELRHLLERAAAERMPSDGAAAVWMSGGWDSTAVFAASESDRLARGRKSGLEIISVSYPPGDPGREDEIIEEVAAHWSRPVHWIRIGDVPLFDRPAERAAERDEPFAHVFETWNRALIARTRGLGARVAFDGNGGDQLFYGSNVFLADLLRTGRWGELRREWRSKGGTDLTDLFAFAVQPLLPPAALRLAAWLRGGRPLRPVSERPLPPWIDPAFARTHDLEGRERAHNPRLRGGGAAANEAYWYMTCPYFPRAYGLLSAFALETGVEVRSPLLDRRVVELAAARPREERNRGRETKRLLRRAMRGLLPDSVLAPRDTKTGTLGGYFSDAMRRDFPALAEAAFRAPLLAEMGIVDPRALREACGSYARTGDGSLAFGLVQTLHVELWLRAREGRAAPRAASPETTRVPAGAR